MGMESDQEIVQLVGRDPRYAGILAPSLQVSPILSCGCLDYLNFVSTCLCWFQECSSLGVFTENQALEYLGTKVF